MPPKELKQKLEKNAEFIQLPKEIQNHIFSLSLQGYSTTSLEEAIHIIKTLSRVNKELNATIHEQAFFLELLHVLAEKFKVDFSTVCNTFGTPRARQCIAQQQLFDLCFNPNPSKETLSDLLNDVLKKGAQLEFMCIYNKQEMTPLMLTCCIGNNKMVYSLLKAGANTNTQNNRGFSALMYCCCLPNSGRLASFSEQNKKSIEPSKNPIENEQIEEFIKASTELLLEDMRTQSDLQNDQGDTALMLAVRSGNIKNVKEIVEYSTVMLKNKHGQSAMDIAQEMNNQAIINILKKKLAQENSSQQKKSKLKKFFK